MNRRLVGLGGLLIGILISIHLSVAADTIPPTVTLELVPLATALVSYVDGEGLATDLDGVANVEYRYRKDGGAWTGWTATVPEDGAFDETEEWYDFVSHYDSYIFDLPSGEYTFQVRATDVNGNTTAPEDYPEASITIDSDPPTIVLNPLVPDPTADSTPTFTGTASDPSHVCELQYRTCKDGGAWSAWVYVLDSSPCSTIPFDFSIDLGPLADGVYELELRARDGVYWGNLTPESDYATDTFIIDVGPPQVLSITKDGPSPTNAASVAFTLSFSEFVTGVDASDLVIPVTGDVTGVLVTSVSGAGSTWTVTLDTGMGDGMILIGVRDDDTIQDAAATPLGGVGADNGNFTSLTGYVVNKTAPEIEIRQPAEDGQYLLHEVVLADWSVSDAESTVTVTASACSGCAIDTMHLGMRQFAVSATDSVGNTAAQTVQYRVILNLAPNPSDQSFDFVFLERRTEQGSIDPETEIVLAPLTEPLSLDETVRFQCVLLDVDGDHALSGAPTVTVTRQIMHTAGNQAPQVEILSYHILMFDQETRCFLLRFDPISRLVRTPGVYDLWLGLADGRIYCRRIEVTE